MAHDVRWLEICADYRCNNRCVGCYAVDADGSGPSMTARELVDTLAHGRARGARWLWLGGGEPTLRKDLFAVVREARRQGYERVKLQTNGMLLSYPEFTRRCVDAGVTEVNFAVKGLPETHDRLTETPGCHALLLRGIDEVRGHGLPMEADVLVYAENAPELPEIVRTLHARGVGRFQLWLFSTAASGGAPDLAARMPRIADVMPHLMAAVRLGLSDRPDFITSLHTPPCTVPPALHGVLFDPAALGLLVANPGGHRFRLEESPIEGGQYLAGCARCQHRPVCGGLRADYLARHGADEFRPVLPAL